MVHEAKYVYHIKIIYNTTEFTMHIVLNIIIQYVLYTIRLHVGLDI